MSNMGCIYGTISWLISLNLRYKSVEENPEQKETTIYFGVYSIIMSVLCSGFIILCAWGAGKLYVEMPGLGISEIIAWLFIIMLAVCVIVFVAELILGGLYGVIYQFRCNSHPVRYAAAAVFGVSVAAMIVGLVFSLGTLF